MTSPQSMPQSAACVAWRHLEMRSVFAGLSADIVRFLNKSPENQAAGDTFKSRLGALATPQLLCLVVYRFAHYLHVNGWKRLAMAFSRGNMLLHKLNLPADSCIGPGCFLPHPAAVTFYGTAGSGLTLYSRAVCAPEAPENFGAAFRNCPLLGDGVTIGAHSSLLGPIEVGERTRISYNVPVRRNLPGGMLVFSPEVFGAHGSRRARAREVCV